MKLPAHAPGCIFLSAFGAIAKDSAPLVSNLAFPNPGKPDTMAQQFPTLGRCPDLAPCMCGLDGVEGLVLVEVLLQVHEPGLPVCLLCRHASLLPHSMCNPSLTDIEPKSCDGRMVSHPRRAEMNVKILGHTLFHTFSFSAKARGPWASKFAFKTDAHVAPYLGGLITSLLPTVVLGGSKQSP